MVEQSPSSPKKSQKRSRGIANGKRAAKAQREQFLPPTPAQEKSDYLGLDAAAEEKLAGSMKYEPPPVDEPTAKYQKLLEEVKLQEHKNNLMYGLPHLYGWKWYTWAREFFESRSKQNFLCAANQISKSSTQIRKAIHWATASEMWPQLWERKPSQFWYLYPSQEVVNIEFELKWEREFLPRGKFKDDPKYGWKVIKDRGDIKGIKFNSGVYLFFKTYTKDVQHLQTGTCDAVFCDEELPEHLYDELVMRLNATDGYFHMVFTATLGQDLWRKCMEPNETEEEVFPSAAKWTISLYEALRYEDATPSHWSEIKIAAVRAKCKSHQEILKRVYGRFIILEGRKYPTFDASRHMKPSHPIPASWIVYSGVDIGSGGESGHPSAIAFIAVSPDYRQGRVFFGWRGDKIQTTDGDVLEKYVSMVAERNLKPVEQRYDHASKDFEVIATRSGIAFLKANKSHDVGEGILNTLFKNDMLFIYEDEELSKAAQEFSTLREKQLKRNAKDDFVDAIRYAAATIPWDFSGITGVPSEYVETPEEILTRAQLEQRERRGIRSGTEEESLQSVEDEIEEWNAAY